VAEEIDSPAAAIAVPALETRPTVALGAIAVPPLETHPIVVLGAIAVPAIETRPTAVLVLAIWTPTGEVEETALAIGKSRTPEARPTGAPLVEHLPGVAAAHAPVVRAVLPAWEAPVVEVPAAVVVAAGGGKQNHDH